MQVIILSVFFLYWLNKQDLICPYNFKVGKQAS